MTAIEQQKLGKILWGIADKLRGAMNADDFRDYMLSFLFLRYLSDNYEDAVKKELGSDYPAVSDTDSAESRVLTPLQIWYDRNPEDISEFEKQMRRKIHYVIKPKYLWKNISELARTQSNDLLQTLQEGFKYIENESFESTFQGLFSEINLNSEKLGKNYAERNEKLCSIIKKIAEEIAKFSNDSDTLGDAYESDRPIRGRFGKESWGVLHSATGFDHPFEDCDIGQPRSDDRSEKENRQGSRFRLRFRIATFECPSSDEPRRQTRHRQDLRTGEEYHDLQPRTHEYATAWGEGLRVRDFSWRYAPQ